MSQPAQEQNTEVPSNRFIDRLPLRAQRAYFGFVLARDVFLGLIDIPESFPENEPPEKQFFVDDHPAAQTHDIQIGSASASFSNRKS